MASPAKALDLCHAVREYRVFQLNTRFTPFLKEPFHGLGDVYTSVQVNQRLQQHQYKLMFEEKIMVRI